jgi:hypothetical protein
VSDLISKAKRISLLTHERILLKLIRSKGIPRSSVEVIKTELADRKPQEGENYYYYSGPLDEKTRAFCRKLLTIDKVVSSTDIDILSNYLDYDVLKYEGSYNCRHKWIRFRGKRILTPELTTTQIRDLVRRGIKG